MLSLKVAHKEMAKSGLPLKPHLQAPLQLLPAAAYLPAGRENNTATSRDTVTAQARHRQATSKSQPLLRGEGCGEP